MSVTPSDLLHNKKDLNKKIDVEDIDLSEISIEDLVFNKKNYKNYINLKSLLEGVSTCQISDAYNGISRRSGLKKEVKPIIEYLTEEDKKRRGRDRCILRIPTPTCSDGSAPTIMATGYASADYKNFYSVGHFPKLAVFEIWHHEPSQEELDAENNALY